MISSQNKKNVYHNVQRLIIKGCGEVNITEEGQIHGISFYQGHPSLPNTFILYCNSLEQIKTPTHIIHSNGNLSLFTFNSDFKLIINMHTETFHLTTKKRKNEFWFGKNTSISLVELTTPYCSIKLPSKFINQQSFQIICNNNENIESENDSNAVFINHEKVFTYLDKICCDIQLNEPNQKTIMYFMNCVILKNIGPLKSGDFISKIGIYL
jgi:hypothetical protein